MAEAEQPRGVSSANGQETRRQRKVQCAYPLLAAFPRESKEKTVLIDLELAEIRSVVSNSPVEAQAIFNLEWARLRLHIALHISENL